MFEKAARMKVRFNYRGLCTVEDLYDIPFAGLDAIYKELKAEAKTQSEDSLLGAKNEVNELLALKIDIVKHVFDVRRAEKDAAKLAIEKAARKQKLLEIIARKQEGAYESMSIEELTKLVNET